MLWRYVKQGALFLLGMCCLTACVLGSDYERPKLSSTEVPAEFFQALPHRGETANLLQWWGQWQDPILQQLVQDAEKNHPNLDRAATTIQDAWANLNKMQKSQFPTLSIGGNGSVSKGMDAISAITKMRQKSIGMQMPLNWELDLFGGNARGIESAQYRMQARTIEWHDARVTLAAETANAYVNLRGCQAILYYIDQQKKSLEISSRLVALKAKQGFAAGYEVNLSQASLAEMKNRYHTQWSQCRLLTSALSLLTGNPRDVLHKRLLERYGQLPAFQPKPIHFLPAEVISRRPDVASIERELAAARSDIGMIQAAQYPKISIASALGIAKAWIGMFELGKSTPWKVESQVGMPILEGGKIQSALTSADSRYRMMYAVYRIKAQVALNDVENANTQLVAVNRRFGEVQTMVTEYKKVLDNQVQMYQSGLGNLIDLENMRRSYLLSQMGLVAAGMEKLTTWVALYRAVGGDWVERRQENVLTNARAVPGETVSSPHYDPITPVVNESTHTPLKKVSTTPKLRTFSNIIEALTITKTLGKPHLADQGVVSASTKLAPPLPVKNQ